MKRFLFLLLLASCSLKGMSQWFEKDYHSFKLGMSAGFGGLYGWGGPSLDLIYRRATLRFAPGLWSIGGGLTYQLASFRPKRRTGKYVILSGYYKNDWLLGTSRNGEYASDKHFYMLMPGIRVNLRHTGGIYMEVSGGPMYIHERLTAPNGTQRQVNDDFVPMAEIRIGGTFLMRRYRTQQFPPPKVKHKGKKPEMRKLKFKK